MVGRMTRRQGLFFEASDPRLAEIIDISSPEAFDMSITEIKKGGVTLKEKRALVLARNRAGAQLGRKNLSPKEIREFTIIKNRRLPDITR